MAPVSAEEFLLSAGQCDGSFSEAFRRFGDHAMCQRCGRVFHFRHMTQANRTRALPLHRKPPADAA